jgi:hypothetical protein
VAATLWTEWEEATPEGPTQGSTVNRAIYVHIAARRGEIKRDAVGNGDMWIELPGLPFLTTERLNPLMFQPHFINRLLLSKSEDNWNASGNA